MKQNNNGFAASVMIYQGPEHTEALLAKDPDALAKQGESLFKAAVEKFGDAHPQFEVIQNAYRQALREFRDARQKATTDDERRKAIASGSRHERNMSPA